MEDNNLRKKEVDQELLNLQKSKAICRFTLYSVSFGVVLRNKYQMNM